MYTGHVEFFSHTTSNLLSPFLLSLEKMYPSLETIPIHAFQNPVSSLPILLWFYSSLSLSHKETILHVFFPAPCSVFSLSFERLFTTSFFSLEKLEPPDKPENVVATSIYSRSAIITWTMSYTGNSAITSFQIESKSFPFIHSSLSSSASSGTSHSSPLFPSSIDTISSSSSSSSSWSDGSSPSLTSDSFLSSSSTWVVQTVTGNSNSITLRKLKPLTRIQVRIRAENMFGWSEYSDILNFVTEEEGTAK